MATPRGNGGRRLAFPAPWTFSSSGSSSSTAVAPVSLRGVARCAKRGLVRSQRHGAAREPTPARGRTCKPGSRRGVPARDGERVRGGAGQSLRSARTSWPKLGTKAAFGGNAATAWGPRRSSRWPSSSTPRPRATRSTRRASGPTATTALGASPDGLVFDPSRRRRCSCRRQFHCCCCCCCCCCCSPPTTTKNPATTIC